MQLAVTSAITLTEFQPRDRATCIARISQRAIYERTLRIPFPYTSEHFDDWLQHVAQSTSRHGGPVHYAIREGDELVGSVGFEGLVPGHKAAIGYWLAREWWGRGIMTAVVGAACRHAWATWRLVRISGHVFASNLASARVLEKNGFTFEGLLRKNCLKDGQYIDDRVYALIR